MATTPGSPAFMAPVKVAGPNGGTITARAQSVSFSRGSLTVLVQNPPAGSLTEKKAKDVIDSVSDIIGVIKDIFGGGGGGGGGGGVKCSSTISQTVGKDGTITTTINTVCQPA